MSIAVALDDLAGAIDGSGSPAPAPSASGSVSDRVEIPVRS
ncbi:hypothetical protein [Pseudonocardia sp. TRM90224]|nr:hypothetical protein [Pseudonocardia sp. TRM90224]